MKAIQILFATAALTIAAPASAELDLRRADVSHLPIGLTVIMLEDHSFPVVSVQMLYKSGSAAEITGKTGLAHFLEHLAFRGSANFPKAGATEAIYDAGGEWHGYTAMDQTTYFATMPKGGLELLLKIEADRMARTVIDPASIEAEKGAVITELHSYENDPSGVLQDAVVRTALQSHPYGSPMAGYVSDVERLTISDAQAYYASHYAPGNAVLAISGDIDLKRAKALVERAFANVAARPIAQPHYTAELPQRGERRTQLLGSVDRQYFQLAFPAPAASNQDFAAFLVLQQVFAGTPGVNPRQSGWSGTRAIEGSLLFGTTRDIATWLPATRDPFLFMISGSIEPTADSGKLEREIAKRIDGLRDRPVSPTQLANAKAAVARILRADVLTTEDAAHQLAYFEGIGALDALLDMNRHVQSVTAADLQRVARNYFAPDRLTVGWMAPGNLPVEALGSGNPKPAADRNGAPANSETTTQPELRRLPGGLSAIVQSSPLSDTVTVELLLDSPVKDGERPSDLPGLGTVSRSGEPSELSDLLDEVIAASRSGPASAESKSDDPETRIQQLIAAQIGDPTGRNGRPLAVIVSGNIDTSTAFGKLEQKLGQAAPGKIGPSPSPTRGPNVVRERIGKPLSQGGLGYVVDGPPPGTREALAWQMMLYVLTHDYSGRLGRSAITEKGLVYHIYSSLRTNGRQTWATIWTGVDPDKADALEIELRTQIATLASEPPTAAETEAARNHILGRDVTAAQSNDELATKLMREFVETAGVRSHEQLRLVLKTITARDLAKAAKTFTKGTILRVDVGAPGN